jgi:hypothetical protein
MGKEFCSKKRTVDDWGRPADINSLDYVEFSNDIFINIHNIKRKDMNTQHNQVFNQINVEHLYLLVLFDQEVPSARINSKIQKINTEK